MGQRKVGPARKAARQGWRFAWLVLPAIAVTGCLAPQFTYVADSPAKTYFKVPYRWHKISDSSLAAQLRKSGFSTGPGVWQVGYDAAGAASASHVLNDSASQPFAFALVAPLSPAASNAMSYNLLRDIILPVTAARRQEAVKAGFPLTGFKLLSDSIVAPGNGVHGVRDIFSYTYPDRNTDTFDQVALTNSNNTMVYLLLVHCQASCYSQNTNQIDTIMTSFTVRNP